MSRFDQLELYFADIRLAHDHRTWDRDKYDYG
ncbi:uncharacterized protein ANIA_11449 [Aspergillus nidulans FGSC A4]|uniref:Uncharacterized protein n=1 Tax=Emericella nidulans (strain FGSC A4 / ATCC 38163 / CBS 112.46 / NRRL 194 / M139) TaxID=227321 RepID=C8VA71_EMENI|nr:hypothetical protein [Aspergillus nidulans FGSC A4]CBF76637.1 TPA: hypothetical protein ANIA_11449 [Aspergillus nidulans FGSC A4]